MTKDENEINDKNTEKIDVVQRQSSDTESDTKTNEKPQSNSTTTILVVSIVVSLLLAGAIFAAYSAAFREKHAGFEFQPNIVTFFNRQSGPRMRRVMIQSNTQVDTSTTAINSGVVTSVSGNNFVIAGNGNQTTVITNGDTTYNTSDKKVSVNDSVMVVGTVSDSKITASDVRIINL